MRVWDVTFAFGTFAAYSRALTHLMNSLNAVGFLVLGSLMNAVPAVVPAAVEHGPKIGDFTPSALWLHFMGILVFAIGGTSLMRDSLAAFRFARASALATAKPVAIPEAIPASASAGTSLQAA